MSTTAISPEQHLRLIRFFLPRLSESQLREELDFDRRQAEARLRASLVDLESNTDRLIADADEALRRDQASNAKGRDDAIHAARQEYERASAARGQRYETDKAAIQRAIEAAQQAAGRRMAGVAAVCVVALIGVAFGLRAVVGQGSPPWAVTVLVIGGTTLVTGLIVGLRFHTASTAQRVRLVESSRELESGYKQDLDALKRQRDAAQADAESRFAASMAGASNQHAQQIERIRAEAADARGRLLAALQAVANDAEARIGDLLRHYGASIASETEVLELLNAQMRAMAGLVAAELGIDEQEVLDERSAEIWAPTTFQSEPVPPEVLEEDRRSEEDIVVLADQLLAPMRLSFADDAQWDRFKNRLLPILRLHSAPEPSKQTDGMRARLSGLSALAFCASARTYVAGHYFYQRLVCTDDFVGIFRAWCNVLSEHVPVKQATHVFYHSVTALGLDSRMSSQVFQHPGIEVEKHTHTLVLELTSGAVYRMSSDAGSVGLALKADDEGLRRLCSDSSGVFRHQIENLRALVRDAKQAARPA